MKKLSLLRVLCVLAACAALGLAPEAALAQRGGHGVEVAFMAAGAAFTAAGAAFMEAEAAFMAAEAAFAAEVDLRAAAALHVAEEGFAAQAAALAPVGDVLGASAAGAAGIGAAVVTVTDGDLILDSAGIPIGGVTDIRTATDIVRGGTLLLTILITRRTVIHTHTRTTGAMILRRRIMPPILPRNLAATHR
jgi:hypothetical protein